MTGPAIRQYLSTCTEANYQEIVQIFRHDLVLYSGMLLSWAVLFDVETSASTSATFKQATTHLQQATQDFHDDAKERLYPQFPNIDAAHPCQETVFAAWNKFYEAFTQFAQPRLDTLEHEIKAYISAPEFSTVIQKNLGTAADGEAIDQGGGHGEYA